MEIPAGVRDAIEASPIAHLVTLEPSGTPHISMAWIGLEGDEVVIGTMYDQPKLENIRRDERVTISFETGRTSPMGLDGYIVLHGRARLTDGGAPQLLQGWRMAISVRTSSSRASRTRRTGGSSASPLTGSPGVTSR